MAVRRNIESPGYRTALHFVISLALLVLAMTGAAVAGEALNHYEMSSTVEYVGQGQFRNQVEGLFTVREEALSGYKVQYSISAGDLLEELSFVVDRRAQRLSQTPENLALWQKINNHCVQSLKNVTKKSIGKTWKQVFDLSSMGESLPSELKFTLTAMKVKNKKLGKMTAVRALSEPFSFNTTGGKINARINTLYIFDPAFEDILLSVSVFESTTTMRGFKEILRHKVATCKADAEGKAVDLKGLGKKFETFVAKVGLTKDIKVTKPSALPEWAKTDGLRAAQAANMCSALSCEGAMNPVVTVSIPTATLLALQSSNREPLRADAQFAAHEGGQEDQGIWEWWVGKVGFWPAVIIPTAAIAIPAASSGGGGGSSYYPSTPIDPVD